jgi:hypothetical protein
MTLTGDCLCGGVRYEVRGKIGPVVFCHCVMCRKVNGSAFAANASVRRKYFHLVSGAELIEEYESSPGKRRAFCRRCGAPVYSRLDRDPDIVRIRLGLLNEDPERRPLAHGWVHSRAPWFDITDRLPRFEEEPRQPPARPDFGLTAEYYAAFRAGFPDSFFARLAALGIGLTGQSLVDLGTGTGTLARGFARRGCRVTGIDPSASMLEQARRLDREAGVVVDYRDGRAEATGLADASADAVTAGQCWHWFDRPAAAREAARVLRRSGRLGIAYFDWLPLPGNVVEATEQLILRHNPYWWGAGGAGIHPQWLGDLSAAGYRDLETFSYDEAVAYTPEAWRGRIRASAGVGASLSPDLVAAFDADLAALLRERFPGSPLQVPHRVFAITARPPA